MSELERIKALSPQERVAGYIAQLAEMSQLGAKLRTKYQYESNDYDECWTEEEEKEWDALNDALDPWFLALSDQEHETLKPVDHVLAQLCRAEWPIK